MPRKKLKKEKKVPKGVKGPYILFSQEQIPKLRRENPNWKVSEFSKEIGRRWTEMDDDARRPYVKASAFDKLRYQKEMEAFQIVAKIKKE